MQIQNHHLTYCTNIHPGESWEETFRAVKTHIPSIKQSVSKDAPFGIGLRLSSLASEALLEAGNLPAFSRWLEANDCYVFTLNGFPYGGFHGQEVKGNVHQPDWTTQARLDYTLRLFDILATLLPAGMDGGVSTSPLSYKPWHDGAQALDAVKVAASKQLSQVAAHLYRIHARAGKLLHLDIEPEPDGVLEDSAGVVDYFNHSLLPVGIPYLQDELGLSRAEAEACLKNHIRICFDSCHFAVVYEKPAEVLARFKEAGIRVGKMQISAALKLNGGSLQDAAREAFSPFVESTYLHQVVARSNEALTRYPDLPDALALLPLSPADEWRTHFHVPIFLEHYGKLASTQADILELFACLRELNHGNHLEVETYTWDVLPQEIQLQQEESIIRELEWVKEKLAA